MELSVSLLSLAATGLVVAAAVPPVRAWLEYKLRVRLVADGACGGVVDNNQPELAAGKFGLRVTIRGVPGVAEEHRELAAAVVGLEPRRVEQDDDRVGKQRGHVVVLGPVAIAERTEGSVGQLFAHIQPILHDQLDHFISRTDALQHVVWHSLAGSIE